MGRRKKKRSRGTKSKFQVQVNAQDMTEEEEEDENITTVKTGLRNVLKPKFRNVFIKAIEEKSIEATKLCALGSLLFLYKVQEAYDTKHIDFFRENGEHVIRDCFLGVLPKNFVKRNTPAEFRKMIDNLEEQYKIVWPDTRNFGNAIKDLYQTYTTNVKNNLVTHAKKRLRQYLRMKIYELNNMNPVVISYEDDDIDHAIAFAVFGENSIKDDDPQGAEKKVRRGMLLKFIIRNSWFNIPYGSIGKFTKFHWFKSIPFWISIQRQLNEFNTNGEYREMRMWERIHFRMCKRQSNGHCECGATKKGPPRIRNLSVIPICTFTRTHLAIDNFTLYSLLSGIGLLPRTESAKRNSCNITFNVFMQNKEWMWNMFFRMRKIKWFVRYKKQFRFRVLSDGISASLAYDVEKKNPEHIEKQREEARSKYESGGFDNESGTDPGLNTWNATTVRSLKTGKEVNNLSIYLQHFNFIFFI